MDLSLQLNQIDTQNPISSNLKVKSIEHFPKVLKGLRNRFGFEDMTKLRKNFAEGLELFLVRRYSLADRKIQLSIDSNIREFF